MKLKRNSAACSIPFYRILTGVSLRVSEAYKSLPTLTKRYLRRKLKVCMSTSLRDLFHMNTSASS